MRPHLANKNNVVNISFGGGISTHMKTIKPQPDGRQIYTVVPWMLWVFSSLGIVKEAMDMEPSMVVEGGQSWWYLGTTNHPTPTYSCHERSMKTLSVSGQRAVKQNRCPVCFFFVGFSS